VLSVDVLREAIEGADMPGQQTVLARLPELYARYVLAIDAPPKAQRPGDLGQIT
jgi:hypothetical protein